MIVDCKDLNTFLAVREAICDSYLGAIPATPPCVLGEDSGERQVSQGFMNDHRVEMVLRCTVPTSGDGEAVDLSKKLQDLIVGAEVG